MNQNKPHYVDINKITLRLPTYKDGDGETYVAISDVRRILTEAPAEDVQKVIRCKDCKFFDKYDQVEDFDGQCVVRDCETDKEEFCSYGSERGDKR